MRISYNKLWKLLIDKEMSRCLERKALGMTFGSGMEMEE